MYMLEGASSVANFITAYEVSIKPRPPFSNRSVFFVSKSNLFDVYNNYSQICMKQASMGKPKRGCLRQMLAQYK